MHSSSFESSHAPLEQTLLALAALAAVALLSFPAARGASEAFGWLPFWLLALPLSAWATARALRVRAARGHARFVGEGAERGRNDGRQPLASVHAIASARGMSVRRGSAQALRRAA